MKGMTFTLSHPSVYHTAGKIGRWFIKNIPFVMNNNLNPWYKEREIPKPPKGSFTEWYKKNKKRAQ